MTFLNSFTFAQPLPRGKPKIKSTANILMGQQGFTLIEIMVVVVVIALMGAIIAPTLFSKVEQAEKTRVTQDVRVIDTALKFYRLDNFKYPASGEGLGALMSNPGSSESWNGPYLETQPVDPWGNPYRYSNPGTHGKTIEVYSFGADNVEGGEGSNGDIGSWNIN